ncbi:adenylate/guanylate cyclase domain-containing protein [Candidatus Ozemobacteraceae bacterium]|nr:adenylate/guanylate cyclase domain-containing protein [Candidatus Ozemobacteraceae bacterium]
MKRTLNLVILIAAFISGIKSFPWFSTQFLIFFGLWIWALILDLNSAGRSGSGGEPTLRKEGKGGVPVIASHQAEMPVPEHAASGEMPATSGPKTPEEAASAKFRLSAAASEKAAHTVFGREYAAFTFEWTNVFLRVMTPSPDWDGRIRAALAEYCALTGITQAQIYAIDPSRPQTMVLAAQVPSQSRPAKRPSFEYAGTSFEKLVAETVQVVPEPKRLDVMPPVPTKIASPLLHGTKLIGLVNVEEAPMGLIDPPLEKLFLYQIGQILGCIVGSMMDQAALETRNRELENEVKKLSSHQQKLQNTAEFLDQEVDRQYFENIDLAKDRERLVNSFQKFVSPVLIERIRNDPQALQPGGSKQLVTVFFSDIRGFTEMSERMDPARIVVQLNEYFNAMTEIVLTFGGMLDKYVGDEIMALFGAPLPLPDAPVRAIYCALEMKARLEILHRKWAKEGFPEFAVGFGITIGEVTAGFIGSEKVLSYTAIGDTVNLASRLCANAQSGEILINSDVVKLLGDALKLEALPPLLVKGKAEPVEVFRVLGPSRLPDFLPPDSLIWGRSPKA